MDFQHLNVSCIPLQLTLVLLACSKLRPLHYPRTVHRLMWSTRSHLPLERRYCLRERSLRLASQCKIAPPTLRTPCVPSWALSLLCLSPSENSSFTLNICASHLCWSSRLAVHGNGPFSVLHTAVPSTLASYGRRVLKVKHQSCAVVRGSTSTVWLI